MWCLSGRCSQCKLWVHKRCCCIQTCPIDCRPVTQVNIDRSLLDAEASFCYLGGMLSAGGGCSLAIITRCCIASGKFKKLLPILTSKHISLSLWEGVWRLCPLCSSSWKWNLGPDRSRLATAPTKWQINDPMDQDVKAHDEISIDLLCARLGIQEVTAALRSKRLRWYGHVVPSSSCTKYVTNMEVPCSKAWGRPRKTWSDCVKADMNACIDPQNRTAWRSGIRSISRLLPTPATGKNHSRWKIKSGSSQVKSSLPKYVKGQV